MKVKDAVVSVLSGIEYWLDAWYESKRNSPAGFVYGGEVNVACCFGGAER